jgi:hypothetical protein
MYPKTMWSSLAGGYNFLMCKAEVAPSKPPERRIHIADAGDDLVSYCLLVSNTS